MEMAKKTNVSACSTLVLSFAVATVLCIILPLQSYLANSESFGYSLSTFLLGYVKVFGFVFLGVATVLLLMQMLAVNILHFAALALMIGVILESGVLSIGLPELNGDFSGYRLAWRSVIDLSILIAVLLVLLMFHRLVFRHLTMISLGVLLYSSLSLCDIRHEISVYEGCGNELIVPELHPRGDVIRSIEFSSKSNVILLILDSISIDACHDVFALDPALREKFLGFVNYCNNIGMGWFTAVATPGLFTGRYWDAPRESFAHYAKSIFMQDTCFSAFLERKDPVFVSVGEGREGYSSRLRKGFRSAEQNGNPFCAQNGDLFPMTVGQLSKFRALPYTLKEWYARSLMDNQTSPSAVNDDGEGRAIDFSVDSELWPLIAQCPVSSLPGKPFVAVHSIGGHPPIRFDGNGSRVNLPNATYSDHVNQCLYVFRLVAHMFDAWRKNGVYDASTIVLCADHSTFMFMKGGKRSKDGPGTAFPFLMVKARASREVFSESDMPTSHSRIADLVRIAGEMELSRKEIDGILKTEERVCRDVHGNRVIEYRWLGTGTCSKAEIGAAEPTEEMLKPLRCGVLYSFNTTDVHAPYPDFIVAGGDGKSGDGIEQLKRHLKLTVRVERPNSKYDVRMPIMLLRDFSHGDLVFSSGKCEQQLTGGRLLEVVGSLHDVESDDRGLLHLDVSMRLDGYLCYSIRSLQIDDRKSLADKARRTHVLTRDELAGCEYRRAKLVNEHDDPCIICKGKLPLPSGPSDDAIGKHIAVGDFVGAKLHISNAEKYACIVFRGRKLMQHGQPTIVIRDSQGRNYICFRRDYHQIDESWNDYSVDLPNIRGDIEIVFNGGYTDRTGSEESCYAFSSIGLVKK